MVLIKVSNQIRKILLGKNCYNLYLNPLGLVRLSKLVLDELSGSKRSRDIANIRYFADSVYLDLILATIAIGKPYSATGSAWFSLANVKSK